MHDPYEAAYLQRTGVDRITREAALCDLIQSRLDAVLTQIDNDNFRGREEDYMILGLDQQPNGNPSTTRGLPNGRPTGSRGAPLGSNTNSGSTNETIDRSGITKDLWAKSNKYSNSRVCGPLPSLTLHTTVLPLLTLSAQYSLAAYETPSGAEKREHISANTRLGTKAMVLKSVPVDAMNVIVLAIRGSSGLADWGVNFDHKPISPVGFLDDEGNLCHSGFLSTARSMVRPVAKRLRCLVAAQQGRESYSLLITGHSAGGAVAALLYTHMLSALRSELTALTPVFKRIHCITYGAPPLTLLPLQKPTDTGRDLKKSLFLSFVNEGDPVTRASIPYMRSLIDLYATPAPRPLKSALKKTGKEKQPIKGILKSQDRGYYKSASTTAVNRIRTVPLNTTSGNANARAGITGSANTVVMPAWPVPQNAFSNAGKIVLLRCTPPKPLTPQRGKTGNGNGNVKEKCAVEARLVTDQQLRPVIFGDVGMHTMEVYAERVEKLAVGVVTMRR
jgi:hypothetical protein